MTTGPSALSVTGHLWSEQEKAVLTRAAQRSCSCAVDRPWELGVSGMRAELTGNPTRDPQGAHRSGTIACGCALAALVGAVRVLGWLPAVILFADPDRTDLVASVTATARHRPMPTDVRYFRAAFAHRPYHEGIDPSDPTQLPPRVRAEIVGAATSRNARVIPFAAITPAHRKRGLDAGLLVVTALDGRRGQVFAGAAVQRAWLAAVANGLAAEPLIQPFESREFRQRLLRHREVTGHPQALLLLGRGAQDTSA